VCFDYYPTWFYLNLLTTVRFTDFFADFKTQILTFIGQKSAIKNQKVPSHFSTWDFRATASAQLFR
jgi:hypothetical protein